MKNFKNKEAGVEPMQVGHLGGPVSAFMATRLITFSPDTPILDAVHTLVEKKISGAPVLNENQEVIGMIDDKVCLRVMIDRAYHNQPVMGNQVTEYMDAVMRTIPQDSDILDVAAIFLESTYKRLLVVDTEGKLVGQISRSDIMRAIDHLVKN